jgi:hypothetical protein
MKLVGEDDLDKEERQLSQLVSKHVHSLVPRRKDNKSTGSETPQRPTMLAETSQYLFRCQTAVPHTFPSL